MICPHLNTQLCCRLKLSAHKIIQQITVRPLLSWTRQVRQCKDRVPVLVKVARAYRNTLTSSITRNNTQSYEKYDSIIRCSQSWSAMTLTSESVDAAKHIRSSISWTHSTPRLGCSSSCRNAIIILPCCWLMFRRTFTSHGSDVRRCCHRCSDSSVVDVRGYCLLSTDR